MLATIVDWSALFQVVVFSIGLGVGVTLAFSFAILGSTRFAESRRDQRTVAAGAYGVLAGVGFALCIAAVGLGIYELVSA